MNPTRTSAPAGGSRQAPILDFLYRIANPTVGAILRSPLHGVMSGSLLLLTFTGRRSGRRITTPVGYQREGDTLRLLTNARWLPFVAES